LLPQEIRKPCTLNQLDRVVVLVRQFGQQPFDNVIKASAFPALHADNQHLQLDRLKSIIASDHFA
jgi:bifunctional DNA-binding transcriptional regulator/antitoxin component of YhaV-PrlF toxin-antitoxin module